MDLVRELSLSGVRGQGAKIPRSQPPSSWISHTKRQHGLSILCALTNPLVELYGPRVQVRALVRYFGFRW
jgi:hypothetical protein